MTLSPNSLNQDIRINSFGTFLRRKFGLRVSKVNVDAGFTCPNRDGSRGLGGCIYCNNSSFSPASTNAETEIEEQFKIGSEYHKKRLGSEKFIVYFQKHTNTYADTERLERLFTKALSFPDAVGIAAGTRPDSVSDEVISLLSELARNHFVSVELGLQSIDDEILLKINRGHTVDEYLKTVERLSGKGIHLCTHLIFGFDGESADSHIESAKLMNSLDMDSVKIHQLHVVRGTQLESQYNNGLFTPISHEKYVSKAVEFLENLNPETSIQRLYGSAPLDIRVAPQWNLKNNQMWYSVINELKKRDSRQGKYF